MTIKEIICEIKENEEIAWDRDFIEEGVFDSLEIMMMVERLEQSYGCSIKGTEIVPENFASIEAIQEMVVRNGGQI
ncbi:MAG: acyl carrier protein [Lachnospiraceae bacterium]|nr:acyl carrier protein [Lachnospiraceae bacterium]